MLYKSIPWLVIVTIIVAVLFFIWPAGAAIAQEVVGATTESGVTVPVAAESAPNQWYYGALVWETIYPYILAAVTAVVGTIITFVLQKINQIFKVQLGDKLKDQLHGAAMTGANIGLSKLGGIVSKLSVNDVNDAVKVGTEWVLKSGAPKAAEKLNATPAEIEALIRAKLNMILTAQTTSATVAELQAVAKPAVITR
jgi:hypothetical protein